MTGDDERAAGGEAEPTASAGSPAPPLPPPAPAAQPAAPSVRAWVPIAALAVVAVALVVLAAVLVGRDGGEGDGGGGAAAGAEGGRLPGELAEVAAVAGEVAEAILTYDYRDMDATLERVREHLSGQFLDVYAETFELVQVPLIEELEAVAVATVTDVYVTAIDGDRARALVELDYHVESNVSTRDLTAVYLRFELTRVDGVWVVQDIPVRIGGDETILPAGGSTDPGDPADPTGSTSTTTAP